MFDSGQEVIVGFFLVLLLIICIFVPGKLIVMEMKHHGGGVVYGACDGIIKWRLLLGQDLSQNSSPCKEKMSRKEKNQEETPQ